MTPLESTPAYSMQFTWLALLLPSSSLHSSKESNSSSCRWNRRTTQHICMIMSPIDTATQGWVTSPVIASHPCVDLIYKVLCACWTPLNSCYLLLVSIVWGNTSHLFRMKWRYWTLGGEGGVGWGGSQGGGGVGRGLPCGCIHCLTAHVSSVSH